MKNKKNISTVGILLLFVVVLYLIYTAIEYFLF